MKLEELKNLPTGPESKWLAIPKDGGKPFIFELGDVLSYTQIPIDEYGNTINQSGYHQIAPEYRGTVKKVALSDCRLHLFTGYVDSNGDEVYGGHIVGQRWGKSPILNHWLVYHSKRRGEWRAILWSDHTVEYSLSDVLREDGITKKTIVGHVHIDPLPDEVKALLDPPEKGASDEKV